MVRILLHGCNGHMGRVVSDLARGEQDLKIVCGVDINTEQHYDFPVFGIMKEAAGTAVDVIVDFSTAKAVDPVIDFAAEQGIPAIICTTALTEAQLQHLSEASKKTAILRSANMALGVNLLMKLAADAAKVLRQNGFDIEIVEEHHRRKIDAPSGTALAIADKINEACSGVYSYNYGRADRHEARPKDEIGISAVRGGTIPGNHDVIFAGADEVIRIQHTSYSRSIWAKGAFSAARYLNGKPAGYYTMMDVIGDAIG